MRQGMATGLREQCGVVAVFRHSQPSSGLIHRALLALQHRGEEAAGMVTSHSDGELFCLFGKGLVADALPTAATEELAGNRGVGHVRYSTVAEDRPENVQPVVVSTPYGQLAIAHNGNLKNVGSLKQSLERSGASLSTTMDTELIAHLVARSSAPDLPGALREAASQLRGAYSLVLLCAGRLYGLRDPYGIRPLVIGKLADGWALASETCALEAINAPLVREVAPGELVEIGPLGINSTRLAPPGLAAPCVFELIYFARPNSVACDQSVYAARRRMGEALASEEHAGAPPDVVVPIPDSGLPAALGYARALGAPLELAMLRSHYVGRTFILPDHDSRTHSLRLKLSVVREAVQGKSVALVDDSIVRGNTARLIVAMVREAGARQVWLRVAAPPIACPCHLGIDTPSAAELVINRFASIDALARHLGVDSLRYLSLAGLARAIGQRRYCRGCMDGDYPT
jgi:amidophosphoribosyltransferase